MGGRALDDIRVVDLSTSFSGAWCSRLLADFGASVFMAEPASGHPLRAMGPRTDAGTSVVAAYVLANKTAVALEPQDPLDRQRLLDVIRSSDVVVSSARPSRLTEIGLT